MQLKFLRAWVGTTCALIAVATCAAPAHAAEQRAYAAAMNYATPAVTVGQGDTLIFSNLDSLAQHDLVGHDGSFKSPLVGGGQEAKVEGVENLQPGTYQFHCTLHSWMRGALTVGRDHIAATVNTCPRYPAQHAWSHRTTMTVSPGRI